MRLDKVIKNTGGIFTAGSYAAEIDAICSDSRKVTRGSLFVAVKGFAADGHEYISRAIGMGARAIVYEVTGVETNIFRFPGGSINSYNKKVYKDIIEAMSAKGYVYYDWNASLEDAVRKPNRDKILKNAKESTLGRDVVVMLGHDTVDMTVEVLEELLTLFPEYEFKAIDETVEPIKF